MRAFSVHARIFSYIYLLKNRFMKNFFAVCILVISLQAGAQDAEIKPAAKGVVYGESVGQEGTIVTPDQLQAKMVNGVFEGRVTGKVTEVCRSMGCWIRLEKADGSSLMVKSRDHGFYMPANIVGKTVVVEGTATAQQVSEAKRRHLAADAGKSKKEQNKIKGAATELQFEAKGVAVLD